MSKGHYNETKRFKLFFLIALSHDSLLNYYNTNFQMMQHHRYSLEELDSMMPWEREIYITLLLQHLEEEREKERMRRQQSRQR